MPYLGHLPCCVCKMWPACICIAMLDETIVSIDLRRMYRIERFGGSCGSPELMLRILNIHRALCARDEDGLANTPRTTEPSHPQPLHVITFSLSSRAHDLPGGRSWLEDTRCAAKVHEAEVSDAIPGLWCEARFRDEVRSHIGAASSCTQNGPL